jgi:hypothetical protein
MSIYLPGYATSSFDTAYLGAGAVWSQVTTWDEFLMDFVQ